MPVERFNVRTVGAMSDHVTHRSPRWTPPPVVAALIVGIPCVAAGFVLDELGMHSKVASAGLIAVTLTCVIQTGQWARKRRKSLDSPSAASTDAE